MAVLSPPLEVIKNQKVKPTEGEWKILNFLLENLNDSYEIFYQPYLNGDNPDLIIMHKGCGVLIIEVKDWFLSHYKIDGSTKWKLKRNNTPLVSPFSQVEKYKENLFHLHIEELFLHKIIKKNNWNFVNCVVYFHNATQQELESFILSNFKDSKYINYRHFLSHFGVFGYDSLQPIHLTHVLSKFSMDKMFPEFNDTLYHSLLRYLKPPIHQIEDGKEITYSKAQQELIRSEIRPRRKIKGVAGSGKTLILAQRAVNAHIRTQSQVLILTYNLSLKNYIHDRISDVRQKFYWNNFYITNYHQFFITQANLYGIKIEELEDFQNESFFQTAKDTIVKYDAVFIDEIQDYLQPWINIITNYFTHNDTEFVVFGDEKQNIYKRKLDENNEIVVKTIPGAWNKSLNASYRFGSEIGNLAIKFQKKIFNNKYSDDQLILMSQFDFEKRIIEYHFFNAFTPKQLFEMVYSVMERNRIHSSDVGLLCSKVEILRSVDFFIRTIKNERTMTAFESQEEYKKNSNNSGILDTIRRFRKDHFYMKSGTVKLATIHSFKGWEIDTLFIFILKENNKDLPSENAELVYTGLTRAKNNLIIFNLGNKSYNSFFEEEVQQRFSH